MWWGSVGLNHMEGVGVWGLRCDHSGQGGVLHRWDVRHPEMESPEMESIAKRGPTRKTSQLCLRASTFLWVDPMTPGVGARAGSSGAQASGGRWAIPALIFSSWLGAP